MKCSECGTDLVRLGPVKIPGTVLEATFICCPNTDCDCEHKEGFMKHIEIGGPNVEFVETYILKGTNEA